MNITPDKITTPKDNEIILVGTNLAGVPGAGFAYFVNRDIEFIKGLTYGWSRWKKAYGIPTRDIVDGKMVTLPLETIRGYIDHFKTVVADWYTQYPNDMFLVTKIGTGHAGYEVSDIAPMFEWALDQPNVSLPIEFIKYLKLNN